MKAVEVHKLRKEFVRKDGRKRVHVEALRGLTFDMERGECIAVLGQNGSGKSTLVRLLSTLLLPDGGSAHIFGHDIAETRAVRRMVNRVSVEASFFKKMSAVENLAYAARFYGLTPRETRERIPEILDRVGFPRDRRDCRSRTEWTLPCAVAYCVPVLPNPPRVISRISLTSSQATRGAGRTIPWARRSPRLIFTSESVMFIT